MIPRVTMSTMRRRLNRLMLPMAVLLTLLLVLAGSQPSFPVQAATDYTVRLHSRTFAPLPGLSPATRNTIITSGRPRYYILVQTTSVPTTRERDALKNLGLRLLVYIPNQAWFASLPTSPSAVDAIAAHPAIRAIVEILPSDRIAGNIKDGIDSRLRYPDGTVALEIQTYSDVPMATARQAISPQVSQILSESEPIHIFLVRLPESKISQLSQLAEVQLITEVAPPPEDDNDGVRIATKASNVQIVEDTVDGAGNMTGIQPGAPYALDGADVLIGQWEPLHPDCSHPDFAGTLDATGAIAGTNVRVTYGDADVDCRDASYNPAGDATIGDHATHVAGTVLGNGSQSAAAGGLPLQWRGMAPNAEIIAYQRPGLDPDGNGVANAAPLGAHWTQYIDAINSEAVLSTNSWGFSHCHQVPGSCYETASAMYDELITNRTNPLRSDAISILGSAGNQGPAASGVNQGTVRIPNSAKNTIVVGNITSDSKALTGTSSRGPVDDGRLKPEVVAPGDQLPSPGSPSVRSTCTSNDPAARSLCAFPYGDMSGTSMSTPATTGAVALIVQQFRTRGADPWPSTVKALLIHTAADQCCADGTGLDLDTPGPDYSYGYGLINVQAAVDLLRDGRKGHVVQAEGFSGSGSCAMDQARPCDFDADGHADDDTYTVNLPPGLNKYRVTLVYDDLPGAGGLLARGAPALRNDLDLFLIAPDGSIQQPWILNSARPFAAATRGVDNLNPVEVVDITNPAGGQWQIVVRPTRLFALDFDPPQRYSLVYQTFEPDVMIRDYNGDDGGIPSARHERGGWTPAKPWNSPDIAIEGGETIMPGIQQAVRVAVTNRGSTTVNNVSVRLYWANNAIHPDFADYFAHFMGSCTIDSLDPGQRNDPANCRIPYTWNAAELLIGDDGKTHVCLLATVEAVGDGLTYPGDDTLPAGVSPRKFYLWDNNIAQQNVVDEMVGNGGEDGTFDFEVNNPSGASAIIQVEQDRSELPGGWQVRILPSSRFTLPPRSKRRATVTLIPPPGAPPGSRSRVSLFGRNLATAELLSGFDVIVTVSGRPAQVYLPLIQAVGQSGVPTPR